jgi:hypothetical protein
VGFCLSGLRPCGQNGRFFRVNVWWWRPLWQYAHYICPDVVDTARFEMGLSNDGVCFTSAEAHELGVALTKAVTDGDAAQAEHEYNAAMAAKPDQICSRCSGTGLLLPPADAGCRGAVHVPCQACGGKGTCRPWAAWYEFSAGNVMDFARFCLECGGFEIW